jgi:hypothetical protein
MAQAVAALPGLVAMLVQIPEGPGVTPSDCKARKT